MAIVRNRIEELKRLAPVSTDSTRALDAFVRAAQKLRADLRTVSTDAALFDGRQVDFGLKRAEAGKANADLAEVEDDVGATQRG
jgi:hypothetical protein